MKEARNWLPRAIGLLFLLMLAEVPTTAWGCPTCKDGLGENYVGAYAFSIVFMMTVPYLILAWFFAYIWYARRRNGASNIAASVDQQLCDLAERKAEQGIPTQPPAWDS